MAEALNLQMAQLYQLTGTTVRTPVGTGTIETVDLLQERAQVLMDAPLGDRMLFWFPVDQLTDYQPRETKHIGTITEVT